jgi:hypothetical protein
MKLHGLVIPKQNYNVLSTFMYLGAIPAHRYMNVGTGNEVAQFHFREYIKSDFRYGVVNTTICSSDTNLTDS